MIVNGCVQARKKKNLCRGNKPCLVVIGVDPQFSEVLVNEAKHLHTHQGHVRSERKIARYKFGKLRKPAVCLPVNYNSDFNRNMFSLQVIEPEYCLLESTFGLNHIIMF